MRNKVKIKSSSNHKELAYNANKQISIMFTKVIICGHFVVVTQLLLIFQIDNFSSILILLFRILLVSMPFLQEHFCFKSYYGDLLLHFVWRGLKFIKFENKNFILPTSKKFAIQNNLLMQFVFSFVYCFSNCHSSAISLVFFINLFLYF